MSSELRAISHKLHAASVDQTMIGEGLLVVEWNMLHTKVIKHREMEVEAYDS